MTNVTPLQRPQADPGTFDEFWNECPRIMRQRASKAVTRQLWTEITTNGRLARIPLRDSGQVVEVVRAHVQATPQEILDGLKRYIEPHYDKQTFKYDEYLCGASVFLNQGRWES